MKVQVKTSLSRFVIASSVSLSHIQRTARAPNRSTKKIHPYQRSTQETASRKSERKQGLDIAQIISGPRYHSRAREAADRCKRG